MQTICALTTSSTLTLKSIKALEKTCTLCVCRGCSFVACADSHLWGVVSPIKTPFLRSLTYVQEHGIHHAADNLGLFPPCNAVTAQYLSFEEVGKKSLTCFGVTFLVPDTTDMIRWITHDASPSLQA